MNRRICKTCGETKEAVQGVWVTSRGKPVGCVCLACNAKRCYKANSARQNTVPGKALHIALSKKWLKENPGRSAATVRKYQTKLANRLPKWLTSDDMFLITEAYLLAALRTKLIGVPWAVDHIIPLRGKYVSGLHVPNNLMVVPQVLNAKKGNYYGI